MDEPLTITHKNRNEEKRKLFTLVRKRTLVPVSIAGNYRKDSFLNGYPVKTIYNGIDTTVFSPRESDEIREKYKINDKFVLLGVANVWDRRKGLNDFIRLSRLLKDNEMIILVGLKSANKESAFKHFGHS